MAIVSLPPPPVYNIDFDSYEWQEWFRLVHVRVNDAGQFVADQISDQISWVQIDTEGSSLEDIQSRSHSVLSDLDYDNSGHTGFARLAGEAQQVFNVGEPTQDTHAVRKEQLDALQAQIDLLQADSIPVGGYLIVKTGLSGAEEPDPNRYIKLSANETGSGQYNEGKLTNETQTGTGPLLEVTAEVADAESPLFGETINLVNTERRYVQPGDNPGNTEHDVMQQITGETISGAGSWQIIGAQGVNGEGAFSFANEAAGRFSGGGVGSGYKFTFDSANSPDARTSDETRPKHIEETYYLKYKN